MHELFEAQVRRAPQAIALVFGDESLTYGELEARANRLAQHLRGLGVGRGVLVGIWLERSVEMVVAMLGTLKAGAAYVPLDPAFPPDRIDFMMDDAALAVVLTQERLAATLSEGALKVVRMDADAAVIARESAESLPPASGPDDLAYVIYTSGSTGRPKGVMIEHRAVVNFLTSMHREPGIGPEDRFVAVTTLSFDIAGLELHGPLTVGGTVVLAPRATALDGMALASLLDRSEATLLQATPATWRLLLESGWKGRPGLKMLCGGEGLPRDLAERLLGLGGELWNMYGPTETTIWSTLWRVTEASRTVPIGVPIANTQVYVLESSGQPAPIGVAGELCIGGDGLARGYLNRAELTAEKFVTLDLPIVGRKRVYRTGDLVRWLADGRLEFIGRRDHQVKLRGFRIELGEIEAVLATLPGVKETVVQVREDTPGDQRLVAYIVTVDGSESDVEAVRASLRSHLPEYMVPNQFVMLAALPLTPNGKVDRKALPVPADSAMTVEPDVDEALMTPLQRKVASIWKQILRVDRVGLSTNFFDIGGHSLLLVRLHMALQRAFGRDLPLIELFQHTTVAAQAARLGEAQTADAVLDRARMRAARQLRAEAHD
ncbi:MAG: amino acid adenylation domain-containing protein [Sinobacteraceae bacterium]|nr:amino acid adenylation domain-containing protein [Nevskiaceae bacterium]